MRQSKCAVETLVTTEVKHEPQQCLSPSGVYSSHPNSHQLLGKGQRVSGKQKVCTVHQSSQTYVGIGQHGKTQTYLHIINDIFTVNINPAHCIFFLHKHTWTLDFTCVFLVFVTLYVFLFIYLHMFSLTCMYIIVFVFIFAQLSHPCFQLQVCFYWNYVQHWEQLKTKFTECVHILDQ